MDSEKPMFQGLLFDDDNEASAEELARQTALEKAQADAVTRKAAWNKATQLLADGADLKAVYDVFRTNGEPFSTPEMAKWAAAHRELLNARFRESYRLLYPDCSDYFLYN